jgi:hypothetical protein
MDQQRLTQQLLGNFVSTESTKFSEFSAGAVFSNSTAKAGVPTAAAGWTGVKVVESSHKQKAVVVSQVTAKETFYLEQEWTLE